jgi:glycerol-3-phosphate dehydrogenase (NAD(P)+)
MKCSILWSGSRWTALAQVLATNNHTIKLRSIQEIEVKNINELKENTPYLPGIKLKEGISCFLEIEKVLENAEIIILALPSHALRSGLEKLQPLYKNQPIILATKGRRTDIFKPLSSLVKEILWENIPLVVLSWASHAEEVIKGIPTWVVLASEDSTLTEEIKKLFETNTFRCCTSNKIEGIQLAWCMKNVIALACWLSDGLGYGVNTKALLLTEGLQEIKKLWEINWISEEALLSYAWIWDLYVTCSSTLSRNRNAGNALAKGIKKQEILSWKVTNMVCEGIYMIDILENYLKQQKDYNLKLVKMLINIINHQAPVKETFDTFITTL